MSDPFDYYLKLMIGISLFLHDHCGFTPQVQAEYMAKAEVFMEGFKADPEKMTEVLKGVTETFEKEVEKEKDKIVNS